MIERSDRLAATGFADQSKRLAPVDDKRTSSTAAIPAVVEGEHRSEALHAQERCPGVQGFAMLAEHVS
jgi:hypothetical protein